MKLDAKPKILLDPSPRKIDWLFTPDDLARIGDLADVIWGRDDPIVVEEIERIKDALSAVITCHWRYGPIEGLPRLRAIFDVAGGPLSPSSLDYDACFRRGIRVLSSAPAFAPTVAEMALGLAIASARGIVDADRLVRQGSEKYSRQGNERAFTLYGRRVGLVGFGGVARALRPLLEPFRCQLLAYDPWLRPAYLIKQGVQPVGLDTLLGTCQVVFVTAIPSPENRQMIDRRRLALIQPDAVLVLVGRAHVVDFEALVEMVTAGRFRAAVDVYPEEPIPPEHPVRRSQNTVLTSHLAGHVSADFRNIGNMVADDLEAILAGLPPMEMQVVQPEIVARLR
jgi:phosphoglycerate dehydrogenase-like enzyme